MGARGGGRDQPRASSREPPIRSTCGWPGWRAGRSGSAAFVTAAPDLVALVWIQSRMVFYIAAAHGYDPHHPMRPAELLALLDLYATPAEARARAGRDGQAHRPRARRSGRCARRNDHGLHLRLARYLARRLTRHYAGRLVPAHRRADRRAPERGGTKDLGRRALAYYGGDQARP